MRSLPFRKYFQIIVGLFNTLVHEKLHHLQLEVTLKHAIILQTFQDSAASTDTELGPCFEVPPRAKSKQ